MIQEIKYRFNKFHLPAFAAFLLLFSACKKDNAFEEPGLKNYFPVNTGHEVIYEVELITKDDFTGNWDSTYYQIREVVAGEYLDNENRLTQRIERYIKNDTAPDWTIYKVYAANVFDTRAEKVEENIRYVKLNFEQYPGMEWNGNAQNTLDPWFYHYTSYGVPFTLGALTFDQTCTVEQFNDTMNLVTPMLSAEIYAMNVGLIYKENRYFEYEYDTTTASFVVENAYIYHERAVTYKK